MQPVKVFLTTLVILIVISACTKTPTPTATPAPEPTVQPTTPAPPTTAIPTTPAPPVTGPTVGELASVGQPFYAASCARCHGATAQGASAPALIGPNAKLDKFGNAQALLQYMSRAMPPNGPGSLTAEQYLRVLAWLLLGNGYVQSDTVLDPNALADLLLIVKK
ncbi:MAG: c-type cytochrome [Anaerolineae bacterium]